MGLRGFQGIQGQARKHAKETVAARKRKRVLPWERKGMSRVAKVIAFLEFLPITKGKLTGRKLKLLPSQRAFIEDLYGRAENDRVRLGIFSEPRGNGKTGLIAGLVLCHLLGPEAEMRGECYSAGIDRLQAGLIFNEMEATILAEPDFAARCNVQRFRKQIEVIDGHGIGSKYEALSSDARRAHGLSPTFWAYDELAQAHDRVLLDNLQTAMGKRKRSLGVVISTQAADDDHPLSQLIDDAQTNVDPSIVVHLLSAPADADPFDPDVVRAVNPAFGKFLDEADVLAEAERARRMPSFESAFRNLRLNQRIAPHARNQLMTPTVWALGDAAINEAMFADGRPVFGGLDLSSTIDLTALVLAAEDNDGNVHLLPRAWTPADTLTERGLNDRAPYDVWVRAGQLTAVPGKAIDYDWVATALGEAGEQMNLRQVNYDRWSIKQFKQTMDRLGISAPLEPMGQGFQDMSPAVKAFQLLAVSGRIRHGNHPLLRMCFINAVVVRDAADNCKLDKSKAYGRIDVAVAAIMAVGALKATTATPEYDVAALIG
jgi:phage terminase large subunit-like protein